MMFGLRYAACAALVCAGWLVLSPATAFRHRGMVQQQQRTQRSHTAVRMAAEKDGDNDAVARRRKRRGKETITTEAQVVQTVEAGKRQVTITPEGLNVDAADLAPQTSEDGTSSLEDVFGLGSNQLRELMEQELPVPREDLVTKRVVKDQDQNKVFKLPDLNEFMDTTGGDRDADNSGAAGGEGKTNRGEEPKRIDRRNQEEYLRVLQLNPYADADDTMFLDEYDIIPALFGSGKLLNIPVPYLQTGHGILLIVSLLAALVYAPGNPLTEFPPEIRTFLKQGLLITYAVNAVLAVQAYGIARSKNLPGVFWAVKSFLVGGVAFYEITQAKDPAKMNEPTYTKPSDRKSQNRK